MARQLATTGLQLAAVLMTCARIIRLCTRAKFTLIRCTSAELLFSCCDSVAAPRQRSRRHDQVSAKNNERLCVCVSRLVTMVCIWCTRSLGRLNLLDFLLRPNALVGGHPGSRKRKQMNNPFYYSSTRRSRVQVLPTRARNNDTWDRRRIVSNMR